MSHSMTIDGIDLGGGDGGGDTDEPDNDLRQLTMDNGQLTTMKRSPVFGFDERSFDSPEDIDRRCSLSEVFVSSLSIVNCPLSIGAQRHDT